MNDHLEEAKAIVNKMEEESNLSKVADMLKDNKIEFTHKEVSYMRSGEASAEEKKQERQRIRAENRRTAKEGKENRSGKSVLDLANNYARNHRDENQPTIDAANANSAAAREAADKLNKGNTANVVQQTTILTNNMNKNNNSSSSVVNTNDSGSIRAQNERLMYGHMH